jgi:putative SOS response-associated peptidase YedK
MALAGIWEVWRDPEDTEAAPVRSCAIVTTSANHLMAPIHDRMPAILEPTDWDAWLDPATDMKVVEGLLRPAPEGVLEAYAVSTQVNNVAHDGPQLLDPLPDPPG